MEMADEMGVSTMSRQELIMLCSSQREEVLNIREQNDELWAKNAELETELEVAKTQGSLAKAKAKPGGMEKQLEDMAAFANQLQEQLAATEKERDTAIARSNINKLAGNVKAKVVEDKIKAGKPTSAACSVQ